MHWLKFTTHARATVKKKPTNNSQPIGNNMNPKRTQIAYRCPDCAVMTVGFLGGLGSVSDMLRLKCSCAESALDIKNQSDDKVTLSVPCVYCKSNHTFVVSKGIMRRDELTKFNCPYSGMGIAFIGDEESVQAEGEKSAEELSRIMTSLEAETVSDIQPQEVADDSVPPDPAIYDTFNFILRDLEAEGEVHCPCRKGEYDLRFTDDGMQVYCKSCGASHDFYAKSVTAAEEYLTIDSITLG